MNGLSGHCTKACQLDHSFHPFLRDTEQQRRLLDPSEAAKTGTVDYCICLSIGIFWKYTDIVLGSVQGIYRSCLTDCRISDSVSLQNVFGYLSLNI